jgi:hypothetical protein
VARRAGKAASRKARQRNVPRAAPRRPAAPPAPAQATDTPEAIESPSTDPPRRVSTTPAPAAGAGSSLSIRERAEYHYVERDLRNIGILTALMLVLLAASWFLFNALGLIG